jgi:integrase
MYSSEQLALHRRLAGPAAVTWIVRRALARAGIHSKDKDAHLLRHSLATRMLRGGATLAQIGQLLRHQPPRTTELYAKYLGAIDSRTEIPPQGLLPHSFRRKLLITTVTRRFLI